MQNQPGSFLDFREGDQIRTDPAEFAREPEIHQIFPNFIKLAFYPFDELDVQYEVWVPHSHAICGQISITNLSRIERKLQVEMVGQLASTEGQRMAPFEMSAATLLTGLTGGLSPVLFVTGGAKAGSGPYPSLLLKIQLEPGGSRQFKWIQAALNNRDASFAMARDLASQNWDAAKSRIEMLNAGQVEIITGESSWDAALMLAQKQAAGLLVGPTPNLPNASFVFTRQPDQGYSRRGDGSDYNHLWNGQTALEAGYLGRVLLPAAPEFVKGLVRNFLFVQDDNGGIDWKPGLGGQRNRLLASPLLADLVWRIFEQTEDKEFLEETYFGLRRFCEAWFSPDHDRDRDGIPEWDHLLQSGLDYHPLYSLWLSGSFGVDITAAESPSLCAMLFHEIEIMARIAEKIGRQEEIPGYRKVMESLRQAVEAAWDETTNAYYDWDRDTHISTRDDWSMEVKGAGIFQLRKDFEHPVRLIIQIKTEETARRRPLLFIHGKGASARMRVEKIGDEQFRWMPGFGQLTGKFVYSHLERIEARGLEPEDRILISCVNFRKLADLTLYAPLWAGIPEPDRAESIVGDPQTGSGLYWREFGLPACPQPTALVDQQSCWSVHLPWNSLIGEGLLRYGMRLQAAELVARLMAGVILSLKKDQAFRRCFHAETGQGIGELHALSGLAPLGLFLDTLGVKLISSRRVSLVGLTPIRGRLR